MDIMDATTETKDESIALDIKEESSVAVYEEAPTRCEKQDSSQVQNSKDLHIGNNFVTIDLRDVETLSTTSTLPTTTLPIPRAKKNVPCGSYWTMVWMSTTVFLVCGSVMALLAHCIKYLKDSGAEDMAALIVVFLMLPALFTMTMPITYCIMFAVCRESENRD